MSNTFSSLFAMPSSQLNPTVLVNYGLPSLDNTRIEWFDNGPRPRPPVTQYGIQIDIDRSTHRYNLNFFNDVSGYSLYEWQLNNSYYGSKDDKRQAQRILDKFNEFDLHNYDAYIAFAKRNPTPGKKKPDLIPDFKIWCIAVTNADKTKGPFVHLHWGSFTYQILPDQWYLPPGAPLPTCKWNARINETDAVQ